MSEKKTLAWKVSTDGPPFIVIDWQGKEFKYDTRPDALAHVERDKRMFKRAADDLRSDVQANMVNVFTEALEQSAIGLDGEQAVVETGEAATTLAEAPREGNRRSRRRNRRITNRSKASRRKS